MTDTALTAALTLKISQAGIVLDRAGLIPCGGGADNLVFAGQTARGRRLIVKAPRREGPRYGTAAWAARALAGRGIPAPQILWHDASICVETRCPGVPLTGAADRLGAAGAGPAAVLRAAAEAGALLRRAHSVLVHGYGRLSPDGAGRYRSLHDSLLTGPPGGLPADPAGRLVSPARGAVAANVWRLADVGPRLLVGDCAARHIFLDTYTGAISGFIDLESARGGQPHADVAGFTLREHPQLARAFLGGYFPAGPSIDDLWALTIHRARIAMFLLLFHRGRSEHSAACRIAEALAGDLAAIASETPTALPAHLQ